MNSLGTICSDNSCHQLSYSAGWQVLIHSSLMLASEFFYLDETDTVSWNTLANCKSHSFEGHVRTVGKLGASYARLAWMASASLLSPFFFLFFWYKLRKANHSIPSSSLKCVDPSVAICQASAFIILICGPAKLQAMNYLWIYANLSCWSSYLRDIESGGSNFQN